MTREKGLPVDIEAERFILGSVVMVPELMVQCSHLVPDDFSLEAHRRIWAAANTMWANGDSVSAFGLRMELDRRGHLDSVGGFEYLNSLDTGIPLVPNIEKYIRSVKDASALRAIIFAAQHTMNLAMEAHHSPDEIITSSKETWLNLAAGRQESTLLSPGEIIEAGGGLTHYLDRKNRTEGLKTGFYKFDVMTGGFKPGAFYVLGARPSMGKTAMFLNMVDNVSVKGESSSLIFTLEMDKQSILDRMICARARVNTKRFECGYMNDEEFRRAAKAAGEINCDRVWIDDKATTDMGEIHAKIRKEQARRPVGLVVIDYLQLMIGGDVKHRVAEASKVSRDMKLVAKDCGVPVLALSQLSRECDSRPDHRPVLSDLRDTGAIEQDADLVMFLYRGEVYDKDREDLRGMAELIVAKQRNGPVDTIPLVWLKEIVRFENAADDYNEEINYHER